MHQTVNTILRLCLYYSQQRLIKALATMIKELLKALLKLFKAHINLQHYGYNSVHIFIP